MRDGKDRFYRTLNLDGVDKKCIKHFRDLVQKMKNDPEKDIKELEKEEEK